ncbi:NlpC-P60 family protein [Ahniella affigens]|uniref:NlpC-P60 family protein n=1 Tax=Ahniella affigens TaxID=2021234 RepID=A0A2P1PSG6_9GAMM|nr:SH3 domain-containing protein [Ahniella affigens]AVP97789.1 NlpC-P60 family protein [Ahniella affigens]
MPALNAVSHRLRCVLLWSLLCLAPSSRAALPWTIDAHHLDAGFWIAQNAGADDVLLPRDQISAFNRRQFAGDRSLRDLHQLPEQIDGDTLRTQIASFSQDPSTRVLASGKPPSKSLRRRWQKDLNLSAIAKHVPVAWGLVTTRADLRTLPTDTALFSTQGSTDLDRLQESALFPGDAVAILHHSRDRQWAFVQSDRYAAWMHQDQLAVGDRQTVLGFATSEPARWILAATAESSFDPEIAHGLRLDMGVRLPWVADWPMDQAVSGQLPLAHWVLQAPMRGAAGRLVIRPILLPKSIASATEPLAYSRANLLRQGFRFLGERYGWGHDDGGRDCSGLIAEIYRSVGIVMPRNTGDQARSLAFARTELPATMNHSDRLQALGALQPGDRLYMPGHVMMLVGQRDGEFYVLHDAHTARVQDLAGNRRDLTFRGVVVTPLSPLLSEDGRSWIDLLTVLQTATPAP